METRFGGWNSSDNNYISIFLSLENPCTFLLAKEKTWKQILTLVATYYKIVQKKELCHHKTTTNVYLTIEDVIYSFLVLIENCYSQQTAARVYCILNPWALDLHSLRPPYQKSYTEFLVWFFVTFVMLQSICSLLLTIQINNHTQKNNHAKFV